MKILEHPEVKVHTCSRQPHFPLVRRAREQQEATPTEKRFLKALHWMRCPKCGHALATERHGAVNVDHCPGCRGVWLDATALEAIVASDNEFLRSCLRNFHCDAHQQEYTSTNATL